MARYAANTAVSTEKSRAEIDLDALDAALSIISEAGK